MCILDPKAMSNISYCNQNFTHPVFFLGGGEGGLFILLTLHAFVSCCQFMCSKFYFFLIGFNPTALRKAKIVYNFGLSECNRVKVYRS